MFYLLLQTWLWVLSAGFLGLLIGWLIWGRGSGEGADSSAEMQKALEECRKRCAELESTVGRADTPDISTMVDGMDPSGGIPDAWRPAMLDGPRSGVADDLKRIRGIGPVIERTLNELGVYHFDQIAAFSGENIRWVDHTIAFPGRIQREGWVRQAKELAGGGSTDFSDRYDQEGNRSG
jgi:predicted flap endonuclease-1-like 5' DNA nuclease